MSLRRKALRCNQRLTLAPVWIVGLTLACAAALSAAPADETLRPPEGFATQAECIEAITSGRLPLISLDHITTMMAQLERHEGVEYGRSGDYRGLLDVYAPPDRGDRPTPMILFIHGGAWSGGARNMMLPYVVRFADLGYVTATVSYRLAPAHPFPAAVEDVQQALLWLRNNAARFGGDRDRIALSGNSAGGHLALMAGYGYPSAVFAGDDEASPTLAAVRAIVNFYGPVDLTSDFARPSPLVHRFLGVNAYEDNPDLFRQASPLFLLTDRSAPTLTLHGTLDDLVPIDQADLLDRRLKELGVVSQYERLEGWPHSMDMARNVHEYGVAVMIRFLERHLGPPAGAASSSAETSAATVGSP